MAKYTTAVRLESEVVDELDQKSEELGLNRSEYIRTTMFIGMQVLENEYNR